MVGKLGGKLAMFENKSAAAADTPADKGAGPKPSPPSTARSIVSATSLADAPDVFRLDAFFLGALQLLLPGRNIASSLPAGPKCLKTSKAAVVHVSGGSSSSLSFFSARK